VLRWILPVVSLIALLFSLASGRAESPLVLKSVSIDLPDDGKMLSGPGADAVNNNCLACHSAGMISHQPVLTEGAWRVEVAKMINVYKAPVAEQDVDAIVAYLVHAMGSK
jgi:hypothetical protein